MPKSSRSPGSRLAVQNTIAGRQHVVDRNRFHRFAAGRAALAARAGQQHLLHRHVLRAVGPVALAGDRPEQPDAGSAHGGGQMQRAGVRADENRRTARRLPVPPGSSAAQLRHFRPNPRQSARPRRAPGHRPTRRVIASRAPGPNGRPLRQIAWRATASKRHPAPGLMTAKRSSLSALRIPRAASALDGASSRSKRGAPGLMLNARNNSRFRSITCVRVGSTRSLFSQQLSSRPSRPAKPIRRGAPDRLAAIALLVSPCKSRAMSNCRPRSRRARRTTSRGDLSQPRGTTSNSSSALCAPSTPAARPSTTQAMKAPGSASRNALSTGMPCSTSPMALSRTIRMRGDATR